MTVHAETFNTRINEVASGVDGMTFAGTEEQGQKSKRVKMDGGGQQGTATIEKTFGGQGFLASRADGERRWKTMVVKGVARARKERNCGRNALRTLSFSNAPGVKGGGEGEPGFARRVHAANLPTSSRVRTGSRVGNLPTRAGASVPRFKPSVCRSCCLRRPARRRHRRRFWRGAVLPGRGPLMGPGPLN